MTARALLAATAAVVLVAQVALAPAPGWSADGQGRYKAIGYGSYHCEDYTASYGSRRVDDSGFGDWLAGYVTGINFVVSSTYDIKGVLDLDGVRDWLAAYCQHNGGDSVAKAARMFVREKYESRQQSR